MNKLKQSFDNKIGTVSKRILIAFTALSLAVIFAIVSMGFDYGNLQVTFYNTKSYKVVKPIRIVLLTDLHLREFGEDNCELIEKVESLEPDIIAMAGDFTINKNPNYDVVVSLVNNLSEIAPVYYSYGNHEFTDILFTEGCTLRKVLDDTNAHILNRKYEKINVKGTDVTIGGFCIGPENFDHVYQKFATEFCEQDGYKILLTHHPELFEDVMKDYPVDLALTGHAHGGQVILPVIGPLYSPDQGFLPKLTNGMQELCGSTVVISRGLGSANSVPRYNNNPEIVVIDIGNY